MKNSLKMIWDKETAGLWPVVKGSLVKVKKPCIRPSCAACQAGRKHPAWLFSYSEGGQRRCMYVPLEMVKTMKQAVKNGRRLEQLLFRMGPSLLNEYRHAVKTKAKSPS